MQDMFKELFKNKRKRRLVIILVLAVVLFVMIVPADNEVVTSEGTYKSEDKSNTPYVVDTAVEEALTGSEESEELKIADSADSGYKIDIDIEAVAAEVIETLDINGGNLSTYLSLKNRDEILQKMIKAELITQYPDLRSVDKIGTAVSDTKEFQGAVKFIRHKTDNTEQVLQYIPLGIESDTGSGTLYGLVNSGNSASLNYFSLNSKGELVLAQYSESRTKTVSGSYATDFKARTESVSYIEQDKAYMNAAAETVETSYKVKEVAYQKAISGYTMPFEYLWSFLVCGKDEQFINDLADLVLQSRIEISIYDSLTVTENATITVYNSNEWKRERTDIQKTKEGETPVVTLGEWGEPTTTTTHHYDITYRKDIYNSLSILAVTKADIWYMTQTVSYTYESTSPTNAGLSNWETSRESENDEDLIHPDEGTIPIEIGTWTAYTAAGGDPGTTYKKRICTQKQTKINQNAVYSADNIEKRKYTINGDPVVDETKLDKSLQEGDEGYPNFCTLYSNARIAKNNLTDYGANGVSRLFNVLANNETTANMVDLTKYVLYKATDMDFGITSLDLTIFEPLDFTKIAASSSQLLVDYIHFWENGSGAPTNADGTKYIVHDDGAGHPTVGYGVDLYNSGYLEVFLAAGYSTEIGALIDVEFVDAIEKQIIQDKVTGVLGRLDGIELTAYQKNALVSRAYNCGTAGAVDTIRNGKNFVQAYQAYWTEEDDMYDETKEDGEFDAATEAKFTHRLYTTYMKSPTTSRGTELYGLVRRRKSEWVLFQTGYYGYETTLLRWHSSGDQIVEAAYLVADHFINSGVEVHYAGSDVEGSTNNGRHCIYGDIEGSWNIPIENPARYGVVCATYVSLALWKADLCTVEQINRYGYNAVSGVSAMCRDAGWEKITNYDELLPGDVWIQDGHVAIYVGDGKYIDQAYCVISSGGADTRGNLRNANIGDFMYGWRCPD